VRASTNERVNEMKATVHEQNWAVASSSWNRKQSTRPSPVLLRGSADLKKLSLSKSSWASPNSTKLKLSPRAKASDESLTSQSLGKASEVSRRSNRARSPSKLALPNIDDEWSTSHSSFKYRTRAVSSTVAAYTGAEQIMAPSDLRTYLLSQVGQLNGCPESDGFVQPNEGTTYNLGSLINSCTEAKVAELVVEIPIEIISRNINSLTCSSFDRNHPLSLLESKSGSYERVPLPSKNPSPEEYDDFFSSEELWLSQDNECVSSNLLINWNAKSEATLDKDELSRTYQSVTFPKIKTPTDLNENHQVVRSDRPDSVKYKPRRHARNLTVESVIILRSGCLKDTTKDEPVAEIKSYELQEHREDDVKNQQVDDEIINEDSSYLFSPRKTLSEAETSIKKLILK
jgi:hypothetical protein